MKVVHLVFGIAGVPGSAADAAANTVKRASLKFTRAVRVNLTHAKNGFQDFRMEMANNRTNREIKGMNKLFDGIGN